MIEVEIKLPVKDLADLQVRFAQMGFVEYEHVREHDAYFDGERGIKERGEALRIRETKNLKTGEVFAQMNFKGQKMDALTMTRQEWEMSIGDALTGRAILSAIGYEPVAPEVVKERLMLKKEDMTACLDQVEGLGSFLELEVLVAEEEKKDAALQRISDILHMFGYQLEDTINTSYLSMLQAKLAD